MFISEVLRFWLMQGAVFVCLWSLVYVLAREWSGMRAGETAFWFALGQGMTALWLLQTTG